MNDEQTDKVLELVVFALKDGTTREQFMGTVDGVTRWIRSQPGFMSYDLSYSAEEHKWVFSAWWQTMQQAKAAAEAATSAPENAPMFALIDMDTMLYLHAEAATAPVTA
ncbi:MAG: hypothetical protein ACRDG9_13275 [Actinomycetota bacterium]